MRPHAAYHESSSPLSSTTLTAITALAVSGCTLLVLALLKPRKLPSPSTSEAIPTTVTGVARKKVRFSEDVAAAEPKGEDDTARRRRRRKRLRPAAMAKNIYIVGKERRSVAGMAKAELPANRNALYGGIYQYRTRMETFMLYAS